MHRSPPNGRTPRPLAFPPFALISLGTIAACSTVSDPHVLSTGVPSQGDASVMSGSDGSTDAPPLGMPDATSSDASCSRENAKFMMIAFSALSGGYSCANVDSASDLGAGDSGATDGSGVGNSGAAGRLLSVSGKVKQSVAGTDAGEAVWLLVLDTCVPGSPCAPDDVTVTMRVRGGAPLMLALPVGAFVQLDYSFGVTQGCNQIVRISNLATLGNAANPIFSGFRTYLVAYDSTVPPDASVGADDEFSVQAMPLGCSDSGGFCNDVPIGNARLRFTSTTDAGGTLDVPMGGAIRWTLHDDPVLVRNFRSYQSPMCGEGGNWGWMVAYAPLSP